MSLFKEWQTELAKRKRKGPASAYQYKTENKDNYVPKSQRKS